MDIEIIVAELQDWHALEIFYRGIYRRNHPLQDHDFWVWQFGSGNSGKAIIAKSGNDVIGHLGVSFGGGYAWLINLYVLPDFRNTSIVNALFDKARQFGGFAVTNSNSIGLQLYQGWQWIRYQNLERFVAIRPDFQFKTINELVQPIHLASTDFIAKPQGDNYWQQPGLMGTLLQDGSSVVLEPTKGGMRFIEIENQKKALEQAWDLGFKWADFVTSWNDRFSIILEKNGWFPEKNAPIPWHLNPLEPNSKSNVSFLSENPLPRDFIVKRSYSDHGRVGSLERLSYIK